MRPSYEHLTDEEVIKECDSYYANPLITELAKRLAEKIDELESYIK